MGAGYYNCFEQGPGELRCLGFLPYFNGGPLDPSIVLKHPARAKLQNRKPGRAA